MYKYTNSIRVLSDVHCKYDEYLNIIKKCDYSIQLGDLGFDYSVLNNVDSKLHKVIPGNHESYDKIFDCPHTLGDFGQRTLNGIDFFFVRGSVSIDCLPRVKHYILTGEKTWWYEEELSNEELNNYISGKNGTRRT